MRLQEICRKNLFSQPSLVDNGCELGQIQNEIHFPTSKPDTNHLITIVTTNYNVIGQTSPWTLFQQLCPTGRLATGPQCQNLQIQQQEQEQQSSTSSSASSQACPPAFGSLCAAQGTTAGSVNTTT